MCVCVCVCMFDRILPLVELHARARTQTLINANELYCDLIYITVCLDDGTPIQTSDLNGKYNLKICVVPAI